MDMTEIRFETLKTDAAVLDGYCSATGESRSDVMREILKKWSDSKLHEATLILRVAGVHPTLPEHDRKGNT